MKMKITFIALLMVSIPGISQYNFSGMVRDAETKSVLEHVKVRLFEDNISTYTDENGKFLLSSSAAEVKSIGFSKDGYTYEEYQTNTSNTNIEIYLRKKKQSSASKRWYSYLASDDCSGYNSVEIPDNPDWAVTFTEADLKGDLAPNPTLIRRDPSAVIKADNLYYVWYTRGTRAPSNWFKPERNNELVFPWDMCDVWYATSTDGWTWEEKGPAVERGEPGSFDDRSVFTPEIFAHKGKYYLVYQVVKAPYLQRTKNNVAMAVANSPNGPWRKLTEPILRPSNNGVWKEGSTSKRDAIVKGDFDSHKVHDPCLIYYNNKFYLYYKGERMGEEKFCGQREIKWGVAISDKPEGPYIKSEYNPITNTGHEVIVWPYKEGIAIIQKLDGPEIGTIQYAKDGVNFEIMSSATHVPDAFGVYRPNDYDSSPKAGIQWGLCHVNKWEHNSGGVWNYLRRFDLVK